VTSSTLYVGFVFLGMMNRLSIVRVLIRFGEATFK